MRALFDCRNAFAETIVELGEADERIVVVNNDSVGSSKTGAFRERFPLRINVVCSTAKRKDFSHDDRNRKVV